MSPAPCRRSEDVSPGARTTRSASGSLESLLALALCAVVVLASVAFLRRSRSIATSLTSAPRSRARPSPSTEPLAAHPRPEIVILISLEALRPDHLDLAGYERETAPHLRALAAEGAYFSTVCAQSSHSLISHKSLFTGKYPATLMLEESGADLFELSVRAPADDYLSRTFGAVRGALAAGFRERGFRTAAFTDGAWLSRRAGFDLGFDVFDDSGTGLEQSLTSSLAWLENSAATSAFLFLHSSELDRPPRGDGAFESEFCKDHLHHGLLAEFFGDDAPPAAWMADSDREALAAHYDGSIRGVDEELGRFFDALKNRALYDRALIVVTADHGLSLGERDRLGHGGLFLEQLLVPLILKFPAAWKLPRARIEGSVELVDLLPTLFTLCGVPTSSDLDGRSLLPLVFRGVRGKDYLQAQTTFESGPGPGPNPAARTLLRPGRWQVIHDPRAPSASFFALANDPRGLVPHAVLEEEFGALLELLIGRRGAGLRSGAADFSADLARELEQLGYADEGRPARAVAGSERAADLR